MHIEKLFEPGTYTKVLGLLNDYKKFSESIGDALDVIYNRYHDERAFDIHIANLTTMVMKAGIYTIDKIGEYTVIPITAASYGAGRIAIYSSNYNRIIEVFRRPENINTGPKAEREAFLIYYKALEAIKELKELEESKND